jgi:acyl carrier protein
MKKKNIKKDKEWVVKILININPEIKNIIKKKNYNLVNDGYIDSLMILRLLFEVEKKFKKKINSSKINRENFYSVENIVRLIKK